MLLLFLDVVPRGLIHPSYGCLHVGLLLKIAKMVLKTKSKKRQIPFEGGAELGYNYQVLAIATRKLHVKRHQRE
jgi:hypothetical protein